VIDPQKTFTFGFKPPRSGRRAAKIGEHNAEFTSWHRPKGATTTPDPTIYVAASFGAGIV